MDRNGMGMMIFIHRLHFILASGLVHFHKNNARGERILSCKSAIPKFSVVSKINVQQNL